VYVYVWRERERERESVCLCVCACVCVCVCEREQGHNLLPDDVPEGADAAHVVLRDSVCVCERGSTCCQTTSQRAPMRRMSCIIASTSLSTYSPETRRFALKHGLKHF